MLTIHTHRSTSTDPAERGRTYGEAWREQIAAAVAEYRQYFEDWNLPANSVRRASEAAGEQIQTAAPNLATEIAAIATGAGLPVWQVLMLNARTEILALAAPAEECSAAVYWPQDGAPHTLQTWDWRPGVARAALGWVIPGEDTTVATFAEFGQVGKIGVNNHGFGLHFNILQHHSDATTPGVPVHVAVRHILATATTVEEAIEAARSLNYSASSVFTVAARSGDLRSACLEVTPVGVAVIEGRRGAALSHTNHFLDPELAAGAKPAAQGSTSPARLEFMHRNDRSLAIADPLQRIAALARQPDVPICVRRDPAVPARQDSETKATIALDLQRATMGMHPGGPRDVRKETWKTLTASASRAPGSPS
ncbi:MAG TPA: C45 family peptidase [Beutenbergiaceae bacterium]|nr:C45 family peptidase [Beutenbergiaceae bacterium]